MLVKLFSSKQCHTETKIPPGNKKAMFIFCCTTQIFSPALQGSFVCKSPFRGAEWYLSTTLGERRGAVSSGGPLESHKF